MRKLIGLAVVVGIAAVAGCGKKSPYEMGTVTGKVTYKGAAVSGATVVLHPAQGKLSLDTTDAEGNYSIECNTGSAKITVTKGTGEPTASSQVPMTGQGGVAAPMDPAKMQEQIDKMDDPPIEAEAAKGELPVKYSLPDTTPESITIVAGENKKDLDLVD